jgi:hypothetical protein
MPIVCVCGQVAEAGDVECSLCGRDLASLRTSERPGGPNIDRSEQTIVSEEHESELTRGNQHEQRYGPARLPGPESRQATPGWATPQTDPALQPIPPMAARRSVRAGIVMGALAVLVTGFALGYFVIAKVLTGLP